MNARCTSLLLLLVSLTLAAASGFAQFTVSIRMDRDHFIRYEPIAVRVSIQNQSARPLQFAGRDWLRFQITDEAGVLVPADGEFEPGTPPLIAPGQAIHQTLDLMRLYQLRRRGAFTVQARVEQDGVVRLSNPLKFHILHGRELWRQTVGVPGAEADGPDETRTYSLCARRSSEHEFIYAGVMDETRDRVYGMVELGRFIPVTEPQAMVDGRGHLHVLYRAQPRAFGYAELDPRAQIVALAVYGDGDTVPRLVRDENQIVRVAGGEKLYPRKDRILTPEELFSADTTSAPGGAGAWWPYADSPQTVPQPKPPPAKRR